MNDTAIPPRSTANDELRAYLTGFCQGKMAPSYAVMLKGAWGSGKTWFIKDFIERLPPDLKSRTLHVSLYGVTKPADIEDALFQQLYPRLANKNVKYGYSLLKGFVKATLKIDLNGDKKDDTTLNISLPELEKFDSNPAATVLVFDDFERAKLAPEELLGYINQFVEHEGRRVIILANEDILMQSRPEFVSLKEKVVGKTFEVTPEPEAALDCFIRETEVHGVDRLLKARKGIILQVFQRAGYGNLRHLRQALLDFAALWECLRAAKADINYVDEIKDRLVDEILSLSIEYRAGGLSVDVIRDLGGTLLTDAEHDRAALHGLRTARTVLLSSAYAHFFERGHLSEVLAAEALARGAYFTDASKPVWQQLWYRNSLTDEHFDKLKVRLVDDFNAMTYRKPEDLLHAFGVLLKLAASGLLAMSTKEVSAQGSQVLRAMVEQDLLLTDVESNDSKDVRLNLHKAYGMIYEGKSLPEFRRFAERVEEEWSRLSAAAMQVKIGDWLNELKTNPALWASRIEHGKDLDNWYDGMAIFASVPAEDFAQIVLTLQAPALNVLADALHKRYAKSEADHVWQRYEAPFWETLSFLLSALTEANPSTTLSRSVLKEQVMPEVKNIADRLRAAQEDFAERERRLLGGN